MWADPSMILGSEWASHVYGVVPTEAPGPATATDYPVRAARYDLSDIPAGFRGTVDAVYIPIPEGFTLLLGAYYTATGTGGIYASPYTISGSIGAGVRLPTGNSARPTTKFSGTKGVWLWVGKGSRGNGTVTITGMTGRLIETSRDQLGRPDLDIIQSRPWTGGEGNSGCRFLGKPTRVETSGLNGGLVQYATTLVEVGSWSNG